MVTKRICTHQWPEQYDQALWCHRIVWYVLETNTKIYKTWAPYWMNDTTPITINTMCLAKHTGSISQPISLGKRFAPFLIHRVRIRNAGSSFFPFSSCFIMIFQVILSPNKSKQSPSASISRTHFGQEISEIITMIAENHWNQITFQICNRM